MTKLILWSKVLWAALFSRSNQLFYDRIATIYDKVFVAHRIHAETILKRLNDIYKDQKDETVILDLGCGTGMLSIMLAEEGYKVVGVDMSFQSLCILKEHHTDVDVIQADASSLPLADNSLHAVVCLGAWRHFPDHQKVLNEVSRVLTAEGVFIVGYFPPDIAGAIPINSNRWGRFLVWTYQTVTQWFGYHDRVDFLLEIETEEASKKLFKIVEKVESGPHKYLIIARHPSNKSAYSQFARIHDSAEESKKQGLLNILRCPCCLFDNTLTNINTSLLKPNHNELIVCQNPECGRKYPVQNGIAVMLVEE